MARHNLGMGAVEVEIRMENYADRSKFLDGIISEDKIRKHTMMALVDTGARMLALPQDVVEVLGLREIRRTVVGYADGRREERPICGPIMLTMAGRKVLCEAIALPPTLTALIGQIPLEGTDLHVDCGNQRLVPDPQSPIYPLMDLK
jgi:predicted aspartyl protease